MHGDWFYTTNYGIYGHEVKARNRSPRDNLTRWIISQPKGFTRKDIEKIGRSVRAYVYLVLTSQVQARSSIVGNSAPVVDAQQVFKGTFKALINEDYSISIDIERYQRVLEHALSKADFSVGMGIYMLPSNLNLNIGKTKGYNNKILVSNTDMKTGSSRDINKDHKKLAPPEPDKAGRVANSAPKIMKGMDKPVKDHRAARHDLKMLTEKYNDEKIAITFLIVGAGCLSFLVENKWHYYSQYFPPSLVLGLMQQRLAALALDLVCSEIMMEKNTKDMIWQ